MTLGISSPTPKVCVALSVAVLLVTTACFAADVRVFPGAEGFSNQTSAGTDGRVIRVTSLKADGPGSLAAAIEAKSPRLVVFEVAGVIDLDGKTIRVSEPFLTVAGQTAPSPGITLIRGGLSIGTHDVLIQHIRVRPGDMGRAKRSGWEPDGISTDAAKNVVIDHCSVTWAVDENLSASGPRLEGPEKTSSRITFSNCIIAEALNNSTHTKGMHSKGSLIHDSCRDIAVLGNLYAHNVDRNPYFKAGATGVIVNNVIYNPGYAAIKLSYVPEEWSGASTKPENARVAIVGNVMLGGANTPLGLPLVSGGYGDAYFEDNLANGRDGKPAELKASVIGTLKEKPVWPMGMSALPVARVLESVMQNAGARPWDRDTNDTRIISDLKNRKGHVINSQEEVGGYPSISPVNRVLNVPDTNRRYWLAGLCGPTESK